MAKTTKATKKKRGTHTFVIGEGDPNQKYISEEQEQARRDFEEISKKNKKKGKKK